MKVDFRLKTYPELAVGGYSHVDVTVEFYQRINALLQPEWTVLDFGAGRGEAHETDTVPYRRALRTLRGKVAKVIGVDVDPVVMSNPLVDEAHILNVEANGSAYIPLPDASVDLILADWVFEHIEYPEMLVRELNRVLKPGGWICARTPNRWGYIALGARLVPSFLHTQLLSLLQPSRKEEDVFPKFYRMNTFRSLRSTFSFGRYSLTMYTLNSMPAYVGKSEFLWRLAHCFFCIAPSRCASIILIFASKQHS